MDDVCRKAGAGECLVCNLDLIAIVLLGDIWPVVDLIITLDRGVLRQRGDHQLDRFAIGVLGGLRDDILTAHEDLRLAPEHGHLVLVGAHLGEERPQPARRLVHLRQVLGLDRSPVQPPVAADAAREQRVHHGAVAVLLHVTRHWGAYQLAIHRMGNRGQRIVRFLDVEGLMASTRLNPQSRKMWVQGTSLARWLMASAPSMTTCTA